MGDADGAGKTDEANEANEANRSAGVASMPSLYEAIGGEGPVRAVLQALYDRLFDDAMIGFLFAGKDKAHIVEQQLAFTCRFLGGPQVYEGLPLPTAHAKLPLLPGHFDRRHRLLEQVLDAEGVPVEVKRVWLQIDSALRPSVLASGEEAREKTRT
jgi:hemoglobin